MKFEQRREQTQKSGRTQSIYERLKTTPDAVRGSMAGERSEGLGIPREVLSSMAGVRKFGERHKQQHEYGGFNAAGLAVGGLLLGSIKLEAKILQKLEKTISERILGIQPVGSGEKAFGAGYNFVRRRNTH